MRDRGVTREMKIKRIGNKRREWEERGREGGREEEMKEKREREEGTEGDMNK